jgi:PEP-CTERM motif-containing protein
MRTVLFTTALLTVLGLGACADHASSVVALESPTPPISPPDDQTVAQPPNGSSNPGGGNPGGGTGFNPGGGTGGGPGGNEPGNGGGNPPGGGGSPVPEPGTMLLVGTGLAGAAFLRRRRQPKVES